MGTVVACSTSEGFPTDAERVLLQVAANQVTIALRNAQVLAEHDRANKDRLQLLVRTRAARDRSAFLAEVSRLLASSLDSENILRNRARAIVPTVADWCAVDLLEEDRSALRQVAAEHADNCKDSDRERTPSSRRMSPGSCRQTSAGRSSA
jgi:hypothetical protein